MNKQMVTSKDRDVNDTFTIRTLVPPVKNARRCRRPTDDRFTRSTSFVITRLGNLMAGLPGVKFHGFVIWEALDIPTEFYVNAHFTWA